MRRFLAIVLIVAMTLTSLVFPVNAEGVVEDELEMSANIDASGQQVTGNAPDGEGPAVEQGAPEGDGPTAEQGAPEGDGPAVEQGAPEGDGPTAEQGAPEGDGPAVEQGAPEGDGATAEQGAPEGDGPAAEQGAPDGEGPSVEQGSLEGDGPAAEQGAPEGEGPAVEQGSLEGDGPVGEQGEPEDEAPAAEQKPALFTKGYVRVSSNTTVYKEAYGGEAVGEFTSSSLVYGEVAVRADILEFSWLLIVFDTEAANANESALKYGYVQGRYVTVVGQAEADEMKAELAKNTDLRAYAGYPLPFAGFAAKQEKTQEAAEKTTTQTETEGEASGSEQGKPEGETPATEQGEPEGETPATEQGKPEGETPATEQGEPEGETPATEQGKPAGETPATEQGKQEGETPATEQGKPEGENPATEQGKPEGETPAAEQGEPEGEAPATEQGKPEGETPATEQGKPESETPVTEQGKPEGETPTTEQGEPEGETPAVEQTTVKPGYFDKGYVRINSDTVIYKEAYGGEAVGKFTSSSLVFAEVVYRADLLDFSWLVVVFDTETANAEGSALEYGYVQGRYVTVLGQAESDQMKAELRKNSDLRMYAGYPLPYSDFSTKGDIVGQQAEGSVDENTAKNEQKAEDSMAVGNQDGNELKETPEEDGEGAENIMVSEVFTRVSRGTQQLSAPVITTYDDRETVCWGDLEDGLVIRWNKVTNCNTYYCAIKLLDGAPNPGDNESGIMLYTNESMTSRKVTIERSKLAPEKWVKVYLGANANGDYKGNSTSIYIYLVPGGSLSVPSITSYSEGAQIEYATWSKDGLKLKWNRVTNATSYLYAVKLLDGQPGTSSLSSETGTMLATSTVTSPTTVTIPASKLQGGKYVKLYVQASSTQDYTPSQKYIYVYLKPGQQPLSVPSITSYSDGAQIEYATWSQNGLKLTWNEVTNATSYLYAVKLLDGQPGTTSVSSETGTMLATSTVASPTTVTIPASKLQGGKYVKLYVQASSTKGYTSSQKYIYVYLKPAQQPLSVPSITSYSDGAQIEYATWSQNGLKLTWNGVTNATSYLYAVKLLDGQPGTSSLSSETGTMLATSTVASPTTVTIPASKLQGGKYVKLYVQASSSKGYTPSQKYIYVYLKPGQSQQLSVPTITSYDEGAQIEYATWSKDGLKLTWNGVTNATSYLYAVKLLDGQPGTSSLSSETGTMLATSTVASPTTVTIPASKLQGGKYVKLYVQASNTKGYTPSQKYIYVYLKPDQSSAMNITSYADRTQIEFATWSKDGVKLTWSSAAGATSYTYAVKLLNGAPGANSDAGTIVGNGSSTSAMTVMIPANKLAGSKWVKMYVKANGGTSTEKIIYVYLEPSTGGLEITSYSDRAEIEYVTWSASGVNLAWKAVSGATSYMYAVKLLNGAPGANGDAGTIVGNGSVTNPVTITIPASKLAGGKYVKMYVKAVSGSNSAEKVIYVYLKPNAGNGLNITTYGDGAQIEYATWSKDGVKLAWSAVTNATSYLYAVKLLDGQPGTSSLSSETGTMLATSTVASPTTITIPASKLQGGKYVKLYVQASNTKDSSSWQKYIYVYLKPAQQTQLSVPAITSYGENAQIEYVEWSVNGVKLTWSAVTNATSYLYAVKLLDGQPGTTSLSSETGTMLATSTVTSPTTITIPASKLQSGKYVKLYVQASSTKGYTSSQKYIYIYLAPSQSEDALLGYAANLIFGNEGGYTTVTSDGKSGVMSIGRLQFHGCRAHDILIAICNANKTAALNALGADLYNEITTHDRVYWDSRVLKESDIAPLKALLALPESKTVQDNQAKADVSRYVKAGRDLNITDPEVLLYYADVRNYGESYANAPAKKAADEAGGYDKITLDIFDRCVRADSIVGDGASAVINGQRIENVYKSRHDRTYAYIKNLNLKANTKSRAQTYVDKAISMEGKTDSYFKFNDSWCGYFVNWVAQQTEMSSIFPSKANCANGKLILQKIGAVGGQAYYFWSDMDEDLKNCATKTDRASFEPQVGDILIVRSYLTEKATQPLYCYAHIAIVSAVDSSSITVVHGNWNSKVTVGTVFSRTGRTKHGNYYYEVSGYARPKY